MLGYRLTNPNSAKIILNEPTWPEERSNPSLSIARVGLDYVGLVCIKSSWTDLVFFILNNAFGIPVLVLRKGIKRKFSPGPEELCAKPSKPGKNENHVRESALIAEAHNFATCLLKVGSMQTTIYKIFLGHKIFSNA